MNAPNKDALDRTPGNPSVADDLLLVHLRSLADLPPWPRRCNWRAADCILPLSRTDQIVYVNVVADAHGLVVPDIEVRTVYAWQDPDLGWAMRGPHRSVVASVPLTVLWSYCLYYRCHLMLRRPDWSDWGVLDVIDAQQFPMGRSAAQDSA
jgi:hypothetical protein